MQPSKRLKPTQIALCSPSRQSQVFNICVCKWADEAAEWFQPVLERWVLLELISDAGGGGMWNGPCGGGGGGGGESLWEFLGTLVPLSQSLSTRPAVCCPCVCVCRSVGGLRPSLKLWGAEGAGRFVNVDQLGWSYSDGGRKKKNALMHKVYINCNSVRAFLPHQCSQYKKWEC